MYDSEGTKDLNFEAGGDTWGRIEFPNDGPWGHAWPCPPGHYLLGQIDQIDPPLVSEGKYQIHVDDLDADSLGRLKKAGKAKEVGTPGGGLYDIGGIILPTRQLAVFGRSAIMIHGGGTYAPSPLAAEQVLCRTMGCTRLHNEDLEKYVAYLREARHGNMLIYSVIGNPILLNT